MRWFCCTGFRTGSFKRNRNAHVNRYGNTCDANSEPDARVRHRHRHKYCHDHAHADSHTNKHNDVDAIPHADAFLYTDSFADSFHYPVMDTESQQYADPYSSDADRNCYTHDHAVPVNARHSSISKVTTLCFGPFR